MKRFITILTLAICAVVSTTDKAQAQYEQGGELSLILNDTVNNAASSTSSVVTIPRSRTNITFQYNVTKVSGTVEGYVQLEATIDTSSSPAWVVIATDTLSDASQNYSRTLTTNSYKKYRGKLTTTGTSQVHWDCYNLYRN